jgi:glycosyltransferase involved in cell wall biosynthesis
MPLENLLPSPSGPPLKIAYLTAGAAGMICGSCLHDNALARALIDLRHDVQLIPLYTPIRVDEEDVSGERIFYGGINMYLQQKMRLFRWIPKWLDRWLDQPWLINWASGRSIRIDPTEVADLALSILRGAEGNQKKEVGRLAEWLTGDLKPEVIVFSNVLTAGCVPEIKRRMNVPIVVTLQGDDVFVRAMPQPQQSQAIAQIRRLGDLIDGFIVNSQFYADSMAGYLGIEREKIAIVPLGLDTRDFDRKDGETERQRDGERKQLTVGYLARLAPEKGLHVLAEAFIRLRQMPGMSDVRLKIAGWLGGKNGGYAEEIFGRLRSAGLGDAFAYVGEVDRRQKLEFLSSLDVLAVPTTYQEPKGLFVLEALAAGVPVVQPEHGAFPEVLAETGGGLLHRPEDSEHLARRLHEVLSDAEKRQKLAGEGRRNVHASRNAREMAVRTVEVLRAAIERNRRATIEAKGTSEAPAACEAAR